MVPAPLSGISQDSQLLEHPVQVSAKVAPLHTPPPPPPPPKAGPRPRSSALSWILLCIDSGNSWPGCCGEQDHRHGIVNKRHFLKNGCAGKKIRRPPSDRLGNYHSQFLNRKMTDLLFIPVQPNTCRRIAGGQQRQALLLPMISLSPQDDPKE